MKHPASLTSKLTVQVGLIHLVIGNKMGTADENTAGRHNHIYNQAQTHDQEQLS